MFNFAFLAGNSQRTWLLFVEIVYGVRSVNQVTIEFLD